MKQYLMIDYAKQSFSYDVKQRNKIKRTVDVKEREINAQYVLKKHLRDAEIITNEDEIIKAMLEFSDFETGQRPKKITRERLIDLASQLNGIMQELLEASEAPAPNPNKRRDLKAERVAKYYNLIQKKLFQKKMKR